MSLATFSNKKGVELLKIFITTRSFSVKEIDYVSGKKKQMENTQKVTVVQEIRES